MAPAKSENPRSTQSNSVIHHSDSRQRIAHPSHARDSRIPKQAKNDMATSALMTELNTIESKLAQLEPPVQQRSNSLQQQNHHPEDLIRGSEVILTTNPQEVDMGRSKLDLSGMPPCMANAFSKVAADFHDMHRETKALRETVEGLHERLADFVGVLESMVHEQRSTQSSVRGQRCIDMIRRNRPYGPVNEGAASRATGWVSGEVANGRSWEVIDDEEVEEHRETHIWRQ